MPLEERRARHEKLYARVCVNDVAMWQRQFLGALQEDGLEHELRQPVQSRVARPMPAPRMLRVPAIQDTAMLLPG